MSGAGIRWWSVAETGRVGTISNLPSGGRGPESMLPKQTVTSPKLSRKRGRADPRYSASSRGFPTEYCQTSGREEIRWKRMRQQLIQQWGIVTRQAAPLTGAAPDAGHPRSAEQPERSPISSQHPDIDSRWVSCQENLDWEGVNCYKWISRWIGDVAPASPVREF
jgi:hypothetical protein